MSSRSPISKPPTRLAKALEPNAARVRSLYAAFPLLKRVVVFYRIHIKRRVIGLLLTDRFSYRATWATGSFISSPSRGLPAEPRQEVPHRIFCFWTGHNKMSDARQRAFDALMRNTKVPVTLITPDNLGDWVQQNAPLHPGYEHLSLVHRSDYLRCYFMHHHGGGYSDIKRPAGVWVRAFADLEGRKDRWIIGYREFGRSGVAPAEEPLGTALRRHWYVLLGNGAYICRPRSPLTAEWYMELHSRMDRVLTKLRASPGNVLGDNSGYPIPWTGILGEIFHPLCLKYHRRLLYSERLRPQLTGYR